METGMQDSEDYNGVLGLEQKAVRLHDPTPLWAELYQQEERRIRAALGVLLVDIQHYGSTAIPGIKAKPILDIMVGLNHFEDAVQCIPLLATIGYDYAPHAGIPGDYTFGKGVRRTHLVHVVAYGSANWTDCLRFRDALRRDPALARAYEDLKVALAQQYAQSRVDYTAAKTAFIQQVITGYKTK
jgi:GrpB-like predicted nucleotidyltransferase (UPF0157 family)